MDVEGNIYLGKNVEFQGNDFTSTEDELNRDALVGALNAIGGSVDGSVAINGTVKQAQVIGAEGRDSDVYGSVIIGQDGAVIMENTDYVMNTDAVSSALAAQEDSEEPTATQQTFKRNMQLSAASASGKTGEVEANVEIYGQYGDASSGNKTANAPINVISAETFESAKARVVINQSEEVAKKSNIDTVNVVRIQKINTDAKFTEGNSSNATATASVDVGGYSKVNELNVLSIAQGAYYGTFDVSINVGENAQVSTINAVKLEGDGSFKGEGTISQTMNIAGKVNTINYFVTGDSSSDDETTDQPVQSESTPKAVAYSIMPAAFAAPAPKAEDSTETPAAPTYKFTVKLEGNASLDKIVGKDGIESITDIHASGNVTLGSIEKSQVGTLLIDASTSDLSKASFTYKGNDSLKADVVQVVTGGRNVEKAFESTNNKEIITNEMRAGDKATVYKAYTKNDKSSFSMGTNFSANGTEVMLGDNTMLSDMEGMTSYMAVDQDNAKSLSEAAAGTAALLTQGSEFVAGQGLDAASAAVARANGGASAFGAVQAGYNEYDTGSSVDLTSVTGLVGFAKGFKFGDDLLTAAVFLDLGYGSSDIHAGSNDTDGKHTYYGIGAGLRYDLSNGLFVDGTLRGGRADTEFDGDINGLKDDYDADAGYFGASLGLGYRYAVNDALSLTPYARYTFTYLGSDSVTTDSGEKLKLDSITAHGLQAGLDLDYAMTDLLTFTAGAGYLGVYNGDADAKVEGLGIDSPSVEGNSGFIKAGLRIAPQGTGFSCDLSAQGYAGDRQGGMGSVMLNYAF